MSCLPVRNLLALVLLALPLAAMADASRFAGHYEGSADLVLSDGTVTPRDMSVTISAGKGGGFSVAWGSTSFYPDTSSRTKSYQIDFRPSDRPGIFAAQMQTNVFGHEVPMDPMKGDPFVWARIEGDTMTVFSLFVDDRGDYEMQQFDRTLAEGGLRLRFTSHRNGRQMRSVDTFLDRR
ncbi:hypothetical protein [Pukyongiella litopenaei]|uniref:DUF1579 domain-containing protein n=1 Tax=Pukyongiella litopenaei TaxID=2605946 RepID=A0A2S0MR03_9RHOB|nr:hypothetical protein [Pukyongiella litopenaei]AVO38181.1 hypothetical protein C6Y53_10990 [Pukyongiella litopenaei]